MAPAPPLSRQAMGRERFYGADARQAYAQSWLLVHYLMARLPDAINACLESGEGPRKIDLNLLEKEIRLHLRKMK